MGGSRDIKERIGADPAVRAAVRAWRRLTGGRARPDADRRTLLACSGGADSSALVLALASATSNAVVAHIVHDLRPAAEALADRDAARELAARCGLPFVERSVRVAALPGNAEANARAARYGALAELAQEHACPFIATAHHADDQAETVLMRLCRGAGPRGLAGIRERRRLGGVTLIRPMLTLRREECRRVCGAAGWSWREDCSNLDAARTRAAFRADVIPELERVFPGAVARIAASAALLGAVASAEAVRARAALGLFHEAAPGVLRALRADLAALPESDLGALFRLLHTCLAGPGGRDRLSQRTLTAVTRAVRDRVTDPRTFALPSVSLALSAHLLEATRTAGRR